MAGRTPIRPGEIRSVQIAPSGDRFRGRARTRDAGGALHRLSATADTPEDCAKSSASSETSDRSLLRTKRG